MSNDIDVRFSGPVFDGRAAAGLDRMASEAQAEIARHAEAEWQKNMSGSFRHPTGAYQSHVNIARRDKDLIINDGWPQSRLPYGLWLEGIGSRNSPVTRFPGYFALRRAAEKTRAEVPQIVAPVVDKYVAEANS